MNSYEPALLVVEDDALVRESIANFFIAQGHRTMGAASLEEAERALLDFRPDVVVTDHELPDGDGLGVLRAVHRIDAAIPVVFLTSHGSIDLAVRAIKEGAEQFLTKPVELPALLMVLERLVERARDRRSAIVGRSRMARDQADPFVGESRAIRLLADQASRLASSSASVLLEGESGTGKGVLAAWFHRASPRNAEPFVEINCAGLSPEFLETELFGHEKGAFTGATVRKPGLFEVAHRGALFLDEIGDTDLAIQPKLLKVLEEQRFRRMGDVRDRQVDVRLLAATHQDLKALVGAKRFREDLYYRISTLPILLPPLRERGGDVVLLGRRILERVASDMGFPGVRFSDGAEKALLSYSWPGNIRELRNRVERAVLLGDRATVRAEDLALGTPIPEGPLAATGRTLAEVERAHIQRVMNEEQGDVKRAALALGLSRSALYERLRRL